MYDRIYVSALDSLPNQQSVNDDLIGLLESYSFDVFFPRTKNTDVNGDYTVLNQPLDFSKMMLVVFHGPDVTPQMEHEIDQAIRRHIPMIALSTTDASLVPAKYLEHFIKVIPIPEDSDELLHPLMTAINRHFPV